MSIPRGIHSPSPQEADPTPGGRPPLEVKPLPLGGRPLSMQTPLPRGRPTFWWGDPPVSRLADRQTLKTLHSLLVGKDHQYVLIFLVTNGQFQDLVKISAE